MFLKSAHEPWQLNGEILLHNFVFTMCFIDFFYNVRRIKYGDSAMVHTWFLIQDRLKCSRQLKIKIFKNMR